MIGYIEYLDHFGFRLSREAQIDIIFQFLNITYAQFIMTFTITEQDKTPTKLLALLRTQEANMQKVPNNAPIMMVGKEGAKGKGKWKGKKKIGSKNLGLSKPVFKKALKPKGGGVVVDDKPDKGNCHWCKEEGHWKRNCPAYLESLKKMKSDQIQDTSIFLIEVNLSTSTSWVLDTGCGSHICINVQEL